jgi:hypothetical protein
LNERVDYNHDIENTNRRRNRIYPLLKKLPKQSGKKKLQKDCLHLPGRFFNLFHSKNQGIESGALNGEKIFLAV